MGESNFHREIRRQQDRQQAVRAFVWGLPALLMLAATVVLLNTAAHHVENGAARDRYLVSLNRANRAEDWDQIELLSRKLALLRPDDPIAQYHLGVCAAHEENYERAARHMLRIAPDDRPGFAPAHWWLARHHAGTDHNTPLDLTRARIHAVRLLELQPEQAPARMLLAQIDLALGQTEFAVREFTAAASQDPALHLAVARVLLQMNRADLAQTHARSAADFYRTQVSSNPHDVNARLAWTDSLTLLSDRAQAADVLQSGLRLQNDPRLREHLAGLCLQTYDSLANAPTSVQSLGTRLDLLQRALRSAPGHEGALLRLAQLAARQDANDPRIGRLMQDVLAKGDAPAMVHTILGGRALSVHDNETARLHFETAQRLQPDSPVCLNNLAWALAQRSTADLPRALQFAETAVELSPDQPAIRETKGQILLMMGQYREALPELERGLQGAVDPADIHRSLARIYDALGQPDLADQHRERESTAVRR